MKSNRRTVAHDMSHSGRAAGMLFMLLVFAVALLSPTRASAQGMSISPMIVNLGASARSAFVTLRNEGGKPKTFTVYAEVFPPPKDEAASSAGAEVVYFPRRLELPGDGEALVRVGFRKPPGAVERVYMLYLEETSPPEEPPPEQGGSFVRFRVRFAVPLFVAPAVMRNRLEISDATQVKDGKLTLRLDNTGNGHLELSAIDASLGDTKLDVKLKQPFVLAGDSTLYEAVLPQAACRSAGRLAIAVRAGNIRAERSIPVAPDMCGP